MSENITFHVMKVGETFEETCERLDKEGAAQNDRMELLHQRDGDVFVAIEQELRFARKQFPNPQNNFAALVEEVGELAKALLNEYSGKEGKGHGVWREAVQVATMAIRVASEGDPRVTEAVQ